MKEIRKNCERITNVHFTKFCKLGPRKLLTCRITNGGPIWSAFYVVSQQHESNIKASASSSSAIICRHCHDVTSDVCHGSTISSADFLRQLNHANKSWPTCYRSSDNPFSLGLFFVSCCIIIVIVVWDCILQSYIVILLTWVAVVQSISY